MQVAGTNVGIASKRPGFEEGLKFPVTGPPAVIGQVGVQGSDQGAIFAFGAQVRVYLPEAWFLAKFHQVPRGVSCENRRTLEDFLRVCARRGVSDINDVHVAEVVELPRPGFAHTHNGQRNRTGLESVIASGNLQGDFQGRSRHVRETGCNQGQHLERLG